MRRFKLEFYAEGNTGMAWNRRKKFQPTLVPFLEKTEKMVMQSVLIRKEDLD
jgi:hypothetical protein